MTDAAHLDGDGETPVNPYSLLEAVNRSSDTAHMGWLIFLAIMAYLLVAVAGVTHKDLLLATPVQLPVLGVEIQQVQFFQFAPILLVLFHLGLVSQLALLARKTLEFDNAVRQLEPTKRRSHPLRLELHNFFFVQGIAGPQRSLIMGLFLHGMSWLTLVIIPVVLLLFIQISFLPYHSVPITWTHRVALLMDIGILALLGVFLTRPETNFLQAFWRSILKHPFGTILTIAVFVPVLFVSFVIATIPGERLDWSVRKYFDINDGGASTQASSYLPVNPLGFLFGRASDGSLFGLFHRNLIVTDRDLVVDKDVSPGEPSISLRGRDLRFARLDRSDLHQADFTGANLDGASLTGANLINTRFNCIDERRLIELDRKRAKCASARRAKFTEARLHGAKMRGVDLRHSDLVQAQLVGADLQFSWLAGTKFSSANLRKALINGGVNAQGASFDLAAIEGANLRGAQLQFADFSNAQMQGVSLAHAFLQGANLRDADLDSAILRFARLHGADLTGANLKAADMRRAHIWRTLPPDPSNMKLANLSGLVIGSIRETDRTFLSQTVNSIEDPVLRKSVQQSVRDFIKKGQPASWAPQKANVWYGWRNAEYPGLQGDYRTELTRHLEQIACKARWSDGSVAQGIARRAIGNQFSGDVEAIHDRLHATKKCAGGKKVSKQFMGALETAMEQWRDKQQNPPGTN